jgi:hypothetical protein
MAEANSLETVRPRDHFVIHGCPCFDYPDDGNPDPILRPDRTGLAYLTLHLVPRAHADLVSGNELNPNVASPADAFSDQMVPAFRGVPGAFITTTDVSPDGNGFPVQLDGIIC